MKHSSREKEKEKQKPKNGISYKYSNQCAENPRQNPCPVGKGLIFSVD